MKLQTMKPGRLAFMSSFPGWSRSNPSIAYRSSCQTSRSPFTPVRSCSDISRQEVEKIAKLAQLRLSEKELERIVPEIGKVITFFDTLSEVDVEGIEPMTSAQALQNVVREDVPRRFSNIDDIMSEAPSLEKDYIRVPKLSSNPSD